jgi:hypothetical protein
VRSGFHASESWDLIRCQVLGIGCQVSGIRYRVSVLGCRLGKT